VLLKLNLYPNFAKVMSIEHYSFEDENQQNPEKSNNLGNQGNGGAQQSSGAQGSLGGQNNDGGYGNGGDNYGSGGGYPGWKPDLPNASTVLVLGIVAIVGNCFCGLISIICGAIALSKYNSDNELYNLNPGNYSEKSYKNLTAGRICAIIGLVLGILSFILGIIYAVVMGVAGAAGGFGGF